MTKTQRFTLAATSLGLFMIYLDALIVNVALPAIQSNFKVGEAGLQWAFQTRHDILILTASGTGGLESIIANTLSPGQRLLVASMGYFGERMVDMGTRYRANVIRVDTEWGTIVEPERIREAVRSAGRVKAVAIVQGETSTGIYQPVHEIARIAH